MAKGDPLSGLVNLQLVLLVRTSVKSCLPCWWWPLGELLVLLVRTSVWNYLSWSRVVMSSSPWYSIAGLAVLPGDKRLNFMRSLLWTLYPKVFKPNPPERGFRIFNTVFKDTGKSLVQVNLLIQLITYTCNIIMNFFCNAVMPAMLSQHQGFYLCSCFSVIDTSSL